MMIQPAGAAARLRPRIWGGIVLLLLFGAAGWSLWHVRWQEDVLADLPHGTPDLAAAQSFLRAWAGREPLLIDIDASMQPAQEKRLAAAADLLADKLRASGLFRRVDSGISPESGAAWWDMLAARLPGLLHPKDYAQIHRRLRTADARLAEWKQQARNPWALGLSRQVNADPLGLTELVLAKAAWFPDQDVVLSGTRLLSRDRKHLLMLAWPAFPASDTRSGQKLFAVWQQASMEVEQRLGPDAPRLRCIGSHRAYADNARQIKRDVTRSFLLSLALITVIVVLALERPWLTPVSLLPAFAGLAASLTAVGLFCESFSLIVWGMISSLLGITVDYGLHVMLAVQRRPQEPVAAARAVRLPMLVCAFTTAGSFLALLGTHFPGQFRLAWFSLTGVLVSAFFAAYVLPYLIPAGSPARLAPRLPLDRIVRKLETWGKRHYLGIIAGFAVLVLIALAGLPRLQFEGDPQAMNALAASTLADEKAFISAFGDPGGRLVVFQKSRDPEDALQQAEALESWLQTAAQQGWIQTAFCLTELIPSRRAQADRAAAFEAEFGPGGRKLLQALYRAGSRQGFSPRAFAGFAESLRSPPAPLTPGACETAGLGAWLRSNWMSDSQGGHYVVTSVKPAGKSAQELSRLLPRAVSGAVVLDKRGLAAAILDTLRQDLAPAVLLAVILVGAVVWFAKKRMEIVWVSLIPLVAALILTLGSLAWMGLKINLINLAAAPMLIGLGVDYAVFRMECTLADYRGRPLPAGSVLLAALTTMAGFGSLALASHPALRSVGLALLLGVGWALASALLLVPILTGVFLPREPAAPPRSLKTAAGGLLIWFYLTLGWLVFLLLVRPAVWLAARLGRKADPQAYLHRAAWLLMHAFPYGRRIFHDCGPEKFPRPCIVVANHESQVDIMLVLSLLPRLHMVVKPWVWTHPILGPLVRRSGFLLAGGHNTGELLDRAKNLLAAGRSLMFFPEGSRSKDGVIRRFHKGAFLLAAETRTDILPVALVNTRACIADDSWTVGNHVSLITPLEPLKPGDFPGEEGPRLLAQAARRRIRQAQQALYPLTVPDWLVRKKIRERYAYLGAGVETYVKWKLKLDPVYARVAAGLPTHGRVLDLGCGFGIMSHWAALTGPERDVVGLDDDARKIEAALHTARYQQGLRFQARSILAEELPTAEAVCLLDVLHYSDPDLQVRLLQQAVRALNPGGRLWVRVACRGQARFGLIAATERLAAWTGFQARRGGLHFADRPGWEQRFRAAGLAVESAEPCGWGQANTLFRLRRA